MELVEHEEPKALAVRHDLQFPLPEDPQHDFVLGYSCQADPFHFKRRFLNRASRFRCHAPQSQFDQPSLRAS